MPSCVLKNCRNNSSYIKKRQGITFHRFPSANDVWKNDWVQIIRDCRNENNWNPSKSSVICSKHFEENDLYTTKGGLLRVVAYAVPKKFLFETSSIQEEQPAEANTSSGVHGSSLVIEAVDSGSGQQNKLEPTVSQNESTPLQILSEPPIIEDKPTDADITSASQVSSSVVGEFSVQGLASQQPCLISTNSSLPHELPKVAAPASGVELEQALSVLYTPRKRRMKKQLMKMHTRTQNQKKKIKTLNQKIRRLQDRNKSLKEILKTLKEKNYVDSDLFNRLNENIVTADLFNNYNRKKLNKKVKYSPSMKKFCLTLNYYSPKAYDYVRQTFDTCLPHRKTLSKWYGRINGEPGFTEESFLALKAKAQVSQHRPLCTLLFDEVAIRAQKIWDGKKYIGLEDMGSGVEEGAPLASQALVFLLVGINHRFKIPLGYFLSNSLRGEQKANLINLCLIKCFDADIDVVAMTCDGHATNFSALESLGCNFKPESLKTTFTHPANGSEVACFLDPSHIMKLLRNQLESKREFVDKDEKKIKWEIIEELNKLQEKEGLHLANKLTKKHVNFKNNKMKVKLATQVYSESVANAIKSCREDLNLDAFRDSEATEVFIKNINIMFDIFNSRAMTQFDFKKPLCSQNKDIIFNFLDELKEYISNLRIKYMTKRKVKKEGRVTFVITRFYKRLVESKCKTGFLGTLLNIESLKKLYENLIENEKRLVFLPTYKLSQDHLEMFFSCIRMQGGFNDNPNVRQFKGCYIKLLAHLEIRCLTTGNCVPLEQIAVLNCSSASQIINTTTPSYRHEEQDDTCNSSLEFMEEVTKEDDDLAQRLNIEQFNDYRKLIIGYLAGSICHYAVKNLKCQKCIARLCTDDWHFFHKLVNLKTRGGLRFPSKDLFDICCTCEMVVRKLLKDNITIYNERQHQYMLTKILEKFIANDRIFSNLEFDHASAGAEHKIALIKYIAEKYLNIRFHHISKLEGIAKSFDSKRQVYKKLTQQKGF